jgi:hypothetical protein
VNHFPRHYFESRERFVALAGARGARLARYPIDAPGPGGEELSIDVAWLGASRPARLLLLLCGTHGVEGFTGSAVIAQWLAGDDSRDLPGDCAALLVHAVNPYGFAHWRRANEHNVDLNRNALARFPGPANPAYRALDGWLNPPSAPRRGDAFLLRGAWLIATRGWSVVKQAIVEGQYEFPRGLFYGGAQRERSTAVLASLLDDPGLRDVRRVVALDLHTGLGRFATARLLVGLPPDSPRFRAMARHFGADALESNVRAGTSAYRVHGGLREHIEERFARAETFAAVLEIGTIALPRMLARLRRENRAFHYTPPGSPARERARALLREAFCPRSRAWRERVLATGARVLRQARALLESRSAA